MDPSQVPFFKTPEEKLEPEHINTSISFDEMIKRALTEYDGGSKGTSLELIISYITNNFGENYCIPVKNALTNGVEKGIYVQVGRTNYKIKRGRGRPRKNDLSNKLKPNSTPPKSSPAITVSTLPTITTTTTITTGLPSLPTLPPLPPLTPVQSVPTTTTTTITTPVVMGTTTAITTAITATSTNIQSTNLPTRKRGRPRKNETEIISPPKKRGRPRKSDLYSNSVPDKMEPLQQKEIEMSLPVKKRGRLKSFMGAFLMEKGNPKQSSLLENNEKIDIFTHNSGENSESCSDIKEEKIDTSFITSHPHFIDMSNFNENSYIKSDVHESHSKDADSAESESHKDTHNSESEISEELEVSEDNSQDEEDSIFPKRRGRPRKQNSGHILYGHDVLSQVDPPKRPRGRPRKNALNDNINTYVDKLVCDSDLPPKRKRGRPRKSEFSQNNNTKLVNNNIIDDQLPPKRPRGRPRKESFTSNNIETPLTPRRGRPPKSKTQTFDVIIPDPPENMTLKRGRGRPRKYPRESSTDSLSFYESSSSDPTYESPDSSIYGQYENETNVHFERPQMPKRRGRPRKKDVNNLDNFQISQQSTPYTNSSSDIVQNSTHESTLLETLANQTINSFALQRGRYRQPQDANEYVASQSSEMRGEEVLTAEIECSQILEALRSARIPSTLEEYQRNTS